ncbi:MAG: BREX-1 system phosphatase PglZ type B, partial [Acidimicrobiia bacterium]|nr:BREX-1 system phosphatase PglZ type B [Acidimicrobiia bacterium]
MATITTTPTTTILDALCAAVRASAAYNRDDVVPPAAILWPDERWEWERLLPRLRLVLPHLLTLGPYVQGARTGPAIWLRCALADRIAGINWPADIIPVLYLPGVSRTTLRATEDCPPELRPLAELQYRGVFFSQVNGKDWTLAAFLQSDRGGLGLRLAKDAATATSIRRAIDKLADVPVADLEAKSAIRPLDGHDFDALIVDDPVDDLLTWLSDPKGAQALWEAGRFEALCSRCRSDHGFDPVRDGGLVGAEKLGLHDAPAWKTAWKRFTASPARYAGLFELLRRAKPPFKPGDLFASIRVESWPQDNEAEEGDLRKALRALAADPVPAARKRLRDLEAAHNPRRDWPWAKLGRSPLAEAVRHLARLAEATDTPLQGETIDDLIRSYVGDGWRADQAALDALAA